MNQDQTATNEMEIIAFSDLPHHLAMEFQPYTVGLIGIQGPHEGRHCGSGTLVKSGAQHFILTAGHCAKEIEKWPELGLTLRSDEHRFVMRVLSPIYIGKSESEEWGPDMAFIPIHAVDVGRINAESNKIFYNLTRHRDNVLADGQRIQNGLWVLVGSPEILTSIEELGKHGFTQVAYSVGVERPTERGEIDYIDIRVGLAGKNVLANFKGMSGGGLWQAEIGHQQDGSYVLIGQPRLEGCAFYETKPQGEHIHIRCHGRRSIYEHGLALLQSQA